MCKARLALEATRAAFAAGGEDAGDAEAIWAGVGPWQREQVVGVEAVYFDDTSFLISVDDQPWQAVCPQDPEQVAAGRRIRALFLEKLEERYPEHPFILRPGQQLEDT